jgi:hypothetical protein
LKPADVVIGISPSSIADAHAANKLVLQYQSYYNSTTNTALLKSLSDLSDVGFQIDHQPVHSQFPIPPNLYVLCPSSKLLHRRVERYVQEATTLGYDGIFVDHTFFDPPAHSVCDAAHEHLGGPIPGGIAYVALFSEVRQTLKATNAAAILIVNPGSDPDWTDQIAPVTPSLWDLADHVLWESYGYTSARGIQHDAWDETIKKSYRYVTATPAKAIKLLCLSYPGSVAEARYAFAVARFFGFEWTANVGEDQQNTVQNGGHFGAFLDDIPFALGQPLGALPPSSPVLRRAFEHGEVFINTSTVAQDVHVPAGKLFLGATTGQMTAPTNITLQPKAAAIVIAQ